MRIPRFIKKKIKGERYSSEDYVDYLRKIGVKIGKNTRFYNVEYALVDTTRPFLIEIGDNVKLTKGITILTHGYDWSVLKNKYGNVMGSAGKVKIGDNVFIGVNTTILKNVTIGSNVIIGACSLVTNDIPDNTVAVGQPAKVIMTIDEYYRKRIDEQEEEAKELVREYRRSFGENPDIDLLKDFFWLFTDANDELNDDQVKNMHLCGSSEISYLKFDSWKKKYKNYADFINNID